MIKAAATLIAAALGATALWSVSGAQQGDILPNPKLTPGAVHSTSLAEICRPGYARSQRSYGSAAERRRYVDVMVAYGIPHERWRDYQMDHLISLELGGADVEANLWPEPLRGRWNAHVKDDLENELHRAVCDGTMPLARAQQLIATDWIKLYQEEDR